MHSSFSFFATAFVGFAAATLPASYESQSYGSNSTTVTSAFSSTSSKPLPTGYQPSSSLYSQSSTTSVPWSSSSSTTSLPGTGSGHPTGSNPTPSSSKTTETDTSTIYTTTTVCPVTFTTTSASSVFITTKLTTSTLTITSCKRGCLPTGYPVANTTQTQSTTIVPANPTTTSTIVETKTYDVTKVETITKFVPCSTPISSSGSQTWYSTFLTTSHVETTVVHPTTAYVTNIVTPATTVHNALVQEPTTTSNSGAGVAPSGPTVSAPAAPGNASPAQGGSTCETKTVYSTVTVSAGGSGPAAAACSGCHTEMVTVTLSNGYQTTLTVTAIPTATNVPGSYPVPGQSQSWSVPAQPSGVARPTGAARPTGTGAAHPTGGSA